MNRHFIEGFVKRAYVLDKAVETLSFPFAGRRSAEEAKNKALASSTVVNAIKKTRQDNILEYVFNPQTSGPLAELSERYTRRYNASKATQPRRTALIPFYGAIRGGEAGEEKT